MNDKEVSELRRHLRPDRHCISKLYGCYVTGSGEILSQFTLPMGQLEQDEQEKYLGILKKTVSGSMCRSLTDVVFTTAQVADSEEHRLLMRLVSTGLEEQAARDALYEKITAAISMEDNYLILTACDRYDVPYRTKDDRSLDDDGEEVFTYVLCSICPVRQSKLQLSYDLQEKSFRAQAGAWNVMPPELGFAFPAFDGRRTNLYGALYYCRSPKENYAEFVETLFHTAPPMPVQTQKQTFASLLSHTLEDECSFDVVQTVHEQLGELMELHRQSKEPEPLAVSGAQVRQLLEQCGVSDAHAASFAVQCDAEFGCDAALSPRNLIDSRKMHVRTPDVVVQVSADRSDLIQTRKIGGVNYILICADEGVEVNGVEIQFPADADGSSGTAPTF